MTRQQLAYETGFSYAKPKNETRILNCIQVFDTDSDLLCDCEYMQKILDPIPSHLRIHSEGTPRIQ